MMKSFFRLKVLAYIILALLFALFWVRLGMVIMKKPGYIDFKPDFYKLESCWSFLRAFFEIFGIQVYFL